MCTIDPSLCWYYDHFDFWTNNPELLKREQEWQKVTSEAIAIGTEYTLKQIKSGRIKAHRIKEAIAGRGDYRYECFKEHGSGPVKESRICFCCHKSIDE